MGHTDFFDRNNYEFNNKSKNGIYIIHGFSNSTYEVRELAEYLGNNGFYTRADNLPGHGTAADDCNRCKYSDWIKFAEKGVSEMDAGKLLFGRLDKKTWVDNWLKLDVQVFLRDLN